MKDDKLHRLILHYGITCYNIGELEQVDIGFHNKVAAKSEEAFKAIAGYIAENYTRKEK